MRDDRQPPGAGPSPPRAQASPPARWNDDKIEALYQEFRDHVAEFREHVGAEAFEQRQQQELYEAVFRKGDVDTGAPPGLLQLTARISSQLHDIKVWQDRQKTFIGGMLFAVTSIWFVLTEAGHKLLALLGAVK